MKNRVLPGVVLMAMAILFFAYTNCGGKGVGATATGASGLTGSGTSDQAGALQPPGPGGASTNTGNTWGNGTCRLVLGTWISDDPNFLGKLEIIDGFSGSESFCNSSFQINAGSGLCEPTSGVFDVNFQIVGQDSNCPTLGMHRCSYQIADSASGKRLTWDCGYGAHQYRLVVQ